MSWDIDLECAHGCNRGSWNYTYNVAPMMAAAAEALGLNWSSFADEIDGLDAHDGASLFRTIANELEANPAKYEAMNPPNGWGSRTGCIEWLREMAAATDFIDTPIVWRVS